MSDTTGRKIVWVTGAGSGIGRALCKRLAQAGWTVAASARTEADLLTLARECPPDRVHAFPLDVTDLEATQTCVKQIETQLGSLDLAVLNAGIHVPIMAADFSVDAFRQTMETNLMGTVHGLAQVIPRFIARGSGHIAVVSSLAGYRGLPTSAAYGATKAGLINMCEALQPDLQRHNVRLTLINPGFVKTPATDRNDFPMPFLIEVDAAADAIIRGLESSSFETTFPRRFAWLMKVLRLLPDSLFFAVTRRMIAK